VLLFTLGISLGTGIFFGLAPAWQATRAAGHAGLRESGGATASRHKLWFDKILVIGQIALSAILLMGAGLFVHSLLNLNRISLGFETDHILLFRLSLPHARYNDAQMTTFFSQLQPKLATLPGVRSVTVSNIGIYGIMAYAVNTRTAEIGLRIALGARANQVLSRILREAFWLTSAGIVFGLMTAFWLTRFIRVMLYGLGSTDAFTVGGTALLLLSVSLVAAFAPARRASRIDPIRALRHD
jgi:hypothetical protein